MFGLIKSIFVSPPEPPDTYDSRFADKLPRVVDARIHRDQAFNAMQDDAETHYQLAMEEFHDLKRL